MHAVLSDASAMRYWSSPPHADREETRAWLERMIASPPETSDDFVVEFEGNVIGKAGCWKVPEIGSSSILAPGAKAWRANGGRR